MSKRKHMRGSYPKIEKSSMIAAFKVLDIFLWELLDTKPEGIGNQGDLEGRFYEAAARTQKKILGHRRQLRIEEFDHE